MNGAMYVWMASVLFSYIVTCTCIRRLNVFAIKKDLHDHELPMGYRTLYEWSKAIFLLQNGASPSPSGSKNEIDNDNMSYSTLPCLLPPSVPFPVPNGHHQRRAVSSRATI